MAVTLTASEVKAFCPTAGGLSDADIDMYIGVAGRADACLDNNQVDDDTQRLLKLNAICHLLTKKMGGQVKSQSDFEGASISWEIYQAKGYGLSSTTFGQQIKSLDFSGCFSFLDHKQGRFMQSTGRNACSRSKRNDGCY